MEYMTTYTRQLQDQWWNTELDKVLTSIAFPCMSMSLIIMCSLGPGGQGQVRIILQCYIHA